MSQLDQPDVPPRAHSAVAGGAGATPVPIANRAVNALRDRSRRLAMAAVHRLGGVFYLDSPDRLLLENRILPWYQLSTEHHAILFVGCDWYTAGYARRMSFKQFATIDPDPSRVRYAATQHYVAPMSRLGDVHAPGSLDLVVCNGVVGWGLDTLDEAERSFEAAFQALRPGGHLVIGWNDIPRRTPFRLEDVAALRRFSPFEFPSLGVAQYRVDQPMRHTFDFLVRQHNS